MIRFSSLLLLVLLLLGSDSARAQNDNGRGRHKQIYAVPAPGAVTIDGSHDEWDLSAEIEMFVIEPTRSTQSATFALMYDAEALYLGAKVNDPSPMMNRHDPKTEANRAWDADSCQFRLTIDPAVGYPISESTFKYKVKDAPEDTRNDIQHLLLWHYTDADQANLQMHTGMTYRSPRPEWEPHGLVPHEHFTAKYLKREDGTGYTFEYRIPWSTLGAEAPLKGGDIVAGTVQFNWSRPDGLSTAGGSAWAYDVLGKPGFAFQSTECWGKIIFSESGNVPAELVSAGVPPERPLPLEFSYELPEDSECTIQLFNGNGESVRILVAQQQRLGGRNIERWDGLDDQGKPLAEGDYAWKGIYHQPITAAYRFSAHNSGNPPHPTDDNKGGWGGDHGNPQTVCALPDGMLMAWESCEYGWGIIRTDLNGKKLWGSNQSATFMATDGKLIYTAGDHGFLAAPEVKMLEVKDARPARLANGIAVLAAPPGGDEATDAISGLAYGDGKLYVSYGKRNLIGVFSTKDGSLLATWTVAEPGRLAVRADGSVAVISQGKVVLVSDGVVTPWIGERLDAPQGIAIGADGTTYVANRGSLQNVSVFDAQGKYLRSIGRAGGRPAMGTYDASGMYEAGGIALDTQGRLWVAETTDGPKRISAWDATSGSNLLEFFGSSGYFGYGAIDPARPNELYAHHVLWGIDWETYSVRPLTTIWRDIEPNMMAAPGPDAYQNHPRMVTTPGGQQYMWGAARKTLTILLRRESDLFKPFAAVMRVGDRDGRYYHATGIASVDADRERFPTGFYFWQDANDDQTVQADECVRMSKELERGSVLWLGKDLSVRLASGHVLTPLETKANGQPVYDMTQAEKSFFGSPSYLAAEEDGKVYTYTAKKGPSLVGWSADGTQRWSYNNITRWHDALNLPVVKAGRLWGMTGIMGVAGDYLANQTYFGLNHIFRTDGIYVAGVLKDGRMGGRGPYEGQPEGQNGSFVKLKLGDAERFFLIHGGQDSRVWEVMNLDTVKDLEGGVYQHAGAMVAKAESAQQAYLAALSGARKLTIARGRKALDVAEPVKRALEDERGFEARAAYDSDNLYVRYEVTAPNELANGISDPQVIFRGGNLLDIQLGSDSTADPERKTPAPGDLRLLVTRQGGKPHAVLFRPKVAGFTGEAIVLKSPTGTESFDSIEVVESIGLEYRKNATGFTATVIVPLSQLGLTLQPGQRMKADLGYIFGNKGGTRTAVRAYVNNNSFTANVVDDIPHESRLEPAEWGEAVVE